MTRIDFYNTVKGLLNKYNFVYDRLYSRQHGTDVDVWIYFTNENGLHDCFFVNSWQMADDSGSVEWYIAEQAIIEGFANADTPITGNSTLVRKLNHRRNILSQL